jgi:hypothetical protein
MTGTIQRGMCGRPGSGFIDGRLFLSQAESGPESSSTMSLPLPEQILGSCVRTLSFMHDGGLLPWAGANGPGPSIRVATYTQLEATNRALAVNILAFV